MANTPLPVVTNKYVLEIIEGAARMATSALDGATDSSRSLSDDAIVAAGEKFTKAIESPKSQLDTSITTSAIKDAGKTSDSALGLKAMAKQMPLSEKQNQQQEELSSSNNKLSRYSETTSANETPAKPGEPPRADTFKHGK